MKRVFAISSMVVLISAWTAITWVVSLGRVFIPFGIVNVNHYARKNR
jgi:hypothetical protein